MSELKQKRQTYQGAPGAQLLSSGLEGRSLALHNCIQGGVGLYNEGYRIQVAPCSVVCSVV
jgi:hypothetical protein